jgi:predicted DNA-binding protein (UPF0251 family)
MRANADDDIFANTPEAEFYDAPQNFRIISEVVAGEMLVHLWGVEGGVSRDCVVLAFYIDSVYVCAHVCAPSSSLTTHFAIMKRHSAEEISSKLREAEALMAHGLSQAQACKKLGVSVMTFHRWRKLDLSGSYVTPREMPSNEAIELREAIEDEAGGERIA